MSAAGRTASTAPGVVRALLDAYGRTYAEEAGIALRDEPGPLYQLLVLALLSSARTRPDSAASAARELFESGWCTPREMCETTRQQRADALGRADYVGPDDVLSGLAENAAWLLDRHHGDLRDLRPTDGGATRLHAALTEAPSIDSDGASIFIREAQQVWPEFAPYFGERALTQAARLRLPADPDELAMLAPRGKVTQLAIALVRFSAIPPG